MSFTNVQQRQYPVEIVSEHYLFAATLEPIGQMMTFLNDPERRTYQLKKVTATNLDPGGTLDRFQAEALYLRRDEMAAIRLLEPVTTQTVPLMPKADRLRVFLPRFVVQATFHRGLDSRLNDIFDMHGVWTPATDAHIFHLQTPRHSIFQEAHTLLVNKRLIRFYQPVQE